MLPSFIHLSVFFNKLVSQSLFTTTFLRSYSERIFLLHKKVCFKKKKNHQSQNTVQPTQIVFYHLVVLVIEVFFRLFSESRGFYSPLSGCISHSINAFRQIDSKVSEIVKFCDNWSTLSVPCSLSPNLSNAVVLFVIVWNTSWVISGTQVSFLYNWHTPSGQRIL